MGIGGVSIWQLVIILVIVLLLFGTKRLRSLGGDLGGAIKGFKKAMGDENTKEEADELKRVDENAKADADTSEETKESVDSGKQKTETRQ